MACKCTTVRQRRCRRRDGTLGRSCSASSSRGGKRRKGRCLKTRTEIQDYGPAKRICVKRAKR